MADLTQIWSEALPDLRKAVTGVGVWTALNTCRALVVEEDVLVIGLPHESSDLSGHLRMSSTKSLIEKAMERRLGRPVTLRVIEGVTEADWALVKRKDAEARRLQEQALSRVRAEAAARQSWEGVYESLSRSYAAIANKSLPQNRARFFVEAVSTLAEARRTMPVEDELGERNFARCLERVSQYTEIPSVLVAVRVSEQLGEG
jgi:hypothetical protein